MNKQEIDIQAEREGKALRAMKKTQLEHYKKYLKNNASMIIPIDYDTIWNEQLRKHLYS